MYHRLTDEVNEVLGDDNEITAENLEKLTYVEQVSPFACKYSKNNRRA